MSEFDGTCGTCPLWAIDLVGHGLCPVFKQACSEKAFVTNPGFCCESLERRTDFIRSLVTGPEFVPEEVQEMIVEAARRPLVEEIYPFGPLESEESK